ncbi:MAG: Na+/H+ antiporter NhaA [Thermoleophilia bacterium]|nr:Na+/H+ antiporter NhaA [Thermoleophilia bacterium]
MPDTDPTPIAAPSLLDPLLDFLRDEVAGAAVLLVATIAALVWANVDGDGYGALWHHVITLGSGEHALRLDLRAWINDALMVVFFFLVGLEIKYEVVAGQLSSRRRVALPLIAAAGGVIVPALLFRAIAPADARDGWAIPSATDIAFAVGVITLLGSRIPRGVKLFLLAVAIIDDIAAITIIAVFFTPDLSLAWLVVSGAVVAIVLLLRRAGIARFWPYVFAGIALWYAVHESGVHATIAGVALGLLTPTGEVRARPIMTLLEHRLHPLSAFVIVPLFALANAGVGLGLGTLADATRSHVVWAVVIGLVVGKLVGIAGATFGALALGIGELPAGMERRHVWGVAALGGIGFTVSLFLTRLAFEDDGLVRLAQVGILAGSCISAVVGSVLFVVLAKRGSSGERRATD